MNEIETKLERMTQSRVEFKRKWKRERRKRWRQKERLVQVEKLAERLQKENESLRNTLRKEREERNK